MSSTFNGQGIFNSGPHRFAIGPTGESMVNNYIIGASPSHGTTAQGALELDIIVTGRLVASSESALWTLRTAIAAQLTHPPTTAKLEDLHMAASVLKGRKVAASTRLLVAPASQRMTTHAASDGTLAILMEAGAILLPTGCGACC